ncbi:hypothetical protein RD792_005428 [Penstemon davidsonii]|uniref:Protein kinase domain-containing protein n=1 Tax=Penstemon davidsonii TaxID=160366 RepID=A0ABR0DK57_9LAMI|nr:hypothetical protein RD792_005428 [Penstemon davidsonii]
MMRNSEIEGRATARPRLMEFDGGGGGEVQGIAAFVVISNFNVDFSASTGTSSSNCPCSFTYKVQPKLVFVSDSSPIFVFEDLLGASAKLLGHGTFGSTYSAAMDNGITVVVKELNLLSMSEVEFKRNMELVQDIRHGNVVELRAYFYSKDEKLMLYDHYTNGSVSALLHGRTGENRANLDWETRKRIAVGAAREVNNSLNVSQASDVYNFGILLLELLTRKSSNEDFDIVMWVDSVKRKEWTTKVFDVDLFKNPAIEDQMVKMLQIGIRCVARAPKKRPKMSAILKIIEDISTMNTKNYISTTVNQNNKLVFFDDLDRGFDLEELFGSSAEMLGKGTFGTSYKYIEVIGKLRHDNVSKLKAYFYSKDEQFLVYDYYILDSVSTILHGKRFVHKSDLGWEERLRVAVGAAKGIAYIHRQDGAKFVHGNIKASNIFLNTQQYSCVTDVGLSMLTSQMTLTDYLAAGYRAPEVTHTKTVSQASDVYSFGVVLFELVSGKTSQITTYDGEVVSLVTWIHSTPCEEWTNEVLDIKLLNYENEEGMVRLLQLAMRCAVINLEDRPKMSEVVGILEEISGINTRLEHLLPMLTLHNE